MPQLDEINGPTIDSGLETKVIAQKVPAQVGVGSKVFEVLLWVLGIIPGVIFLFKKISAKKYFQQLEQKLQQDRSSIDNYMEQRVVILSNCAKLVEKAVTLDKETFTEIARLRSFNSGSQGDDLNEKMGAIDKVNRQINVALENYPNLDAHKEIQDAISQNSYLQKEITAAREVYNSRVNTWNREIFSWPTKAIVAAKMGLTTIIPFSTSQEIKKRSKEVFF